APVRTASDRIGDGAGWHHPAPPPQNRCVGSCHGSQGVGPDGEQLSLPGAVRSGSAATAAVNFAGRARGHRSLTTRWALPLYVGIGVFARTPVHRAFPFLASLLSQP